jgi:hypothetical protein
VVRLPQAFDEGPFGSGYPKLPRETGHATDGQLLETVQFQGRGSCEEEDTGGADLERSPPSIAMQRTLVPNRVRGPQKLQGAVVGEDSVGSGRRRDQERIRPKPMSVETWRNGCINLPSNGLDSPARQVTLELIPSRGELIAISACVSKLLECEHW